MMRLFKRIFGIGHSKESGIRIDPEAYGLKLGIERIERRPVCNSRYDQFVNIRRKRNRRLNEISFESRRRNRV